MPRRNAQILDARALLKRAVDGEKMVDRLKKQNAKLVRELTAARELVVLPRHRT